MNVYAHKYISLNGREIAIHDIRSGTVATNTDFEFATISFLKEWINGSVTFVQKTSGSTGTPKDIVITRDQMISSARATGQALDLKPDYNALICLDTRFIAGKMMCVRSFVTGMKMIINEPSANPFSGLPSQPVVDFVALVPYQVEEILSSTKAQVLNQVATVIIGGAPMKPSVVDQLNHFKARCYLTYGMTETMSHVALHRVGGDDPVGVFRCLPDAEIEVDQRGCLVVSVPWLLEKVRTNDLVEIISSRKFRWVGRFDHIINTGGFKVNPEKIEFQIEKIFKRLNVDRRFFVAGIPDEKTGERVVLFIEGQEIPRLFDELQNRLKQLIQWFEMPKSVHFISTFRFTSTDKLDRTRTLQSHKTS